MPKVRLLRQVTNTRLRAILPPGQHEVTEAEAAVYRQRGWTDRPPEPAARPVTAAAAEESALVRIPQNWSTFHHLQIKRIAGEIAARVITSKVEAVEIIEAEIDRRKGQASAAG